MSPIETRNRKPARRGFAAMDKERQREIARKGGASVPDEKRSFSQDRDLAAAAGRKGGEASHGGGRRRAEPAGDIARP
jgi:general stress protein YciG